jgi:hypothetical protein
VKDEIPRVTLAMRRRASEAWEKYRSSFRTGERLPPYEIPEADADLWDCGVSYTPERLESLGNKPCKECGNWCESRWPRCELCRIAGHLRKGYTSAKLRRYAHEAKTRIARVLRPRA